MDNMLFKIWVKMELNLLMSHKDTSTTAASFKMRVSRSLQWTEAVFRKLLAYKGQWYSFSLLPLSRSSFSFTSSSAPGWLKTHYIAPGWSLIYLSLPAAASFQVQVLGLQAMPPTASC